MVPISGMVIWKSESNSSRNASNSSSARSTSSMSRTARSPARTASSKRALEQELRAEQLVDRVVVVQLPLGQRPDLEHLAGVVPLVQRLVGVDALVALQPDQPAPEDRREHLGHLGLADADLALDQDRAVQRQRDEQRGREPAVGQVAAVAQDLGQLSHGLRTVHPASFSHSQKAPPGVSDLRGCPARGRGCCRPTS